MTRWRRLLVPGLSTALMLLVLCGLGLWQVRRLQWKTALLARIDAAEATPGIPLPAVPQRFEKVRVSGTVRPGVFGRYGVEVRDTAKGQEIGGQIIVLLDPARSSGATLPPVLTLLGWAPFTLSPVLPSGRLDLEGYIREPVRPGILSAANDPEKRVFYTLDVPVIGRGLGAAAVAPFVVVVMGRPVPGIYPAPSTAMPRPPNNHLQYVFTWFGLAAALLVIFVVYVRKVPSA